MNTKIIWANFLNVIKNELNPLSFETWFKNTELYEYKDGVCKIIVPMAMYKKHLATKYYELIVDNLSNVVGDNVDIEFYTKEEIDELENENTSNDNINPMYIHNNVDNVGKSIDNSNVINNFCSNLNKNYSWEYK